jgi:glycosyltransferase involved in cell wall biosynthesis
MLLKILTGTPLLFDDHNVEYLRLRRMGSLAWPFVGLLEFITCHIADRVICVSDTDKKYLTQRLGVPLHKIQVAVNGADVEYLIHYEVDIDSVRSSIGVKPDEVMILFFGNLRYSPNAQAVGIILDQILPQLDSQDHSIRVVIAGSGDLEVRKRYDRIPSNVIFTGFVDDIAALIKSADLVIAPLTSGSGTRLKIIESVACGRRVISTTIGAEGLDQRTLGDSLVICDEWDAFAQAVVETINWGALAPSPAFIQTYDWRHIVQRLRI